MKGFPPDDAKQIPHYYFSKQELRDFLGQYFDNVQIKQVAQNKGKIWFAHYRK